LKSKCFHKHGNKVIIVLLLLFIILLATLLNRGI
jgi:hypothetical protein